MSASSFSTRSAMRASASSRSALPSLWTVLSSCSSSLSETVKTGSGSFPKRTNRSFSFIVSQEEGKMPSLPEKSVFSENFYACETARRLLRRFTVSSYGTSTVSVLLVLAYTFPAASSSLNRLSVCTTR